MNRDTFLAGDLVTLRRVPLDPMFTVKSVIENKLELDTLYTVEVVYKSQLMVIEIPYQCWNIYRFIKVPKEIRDLPPKDLKCAINLLEI